MDFLIYVWILVIIGALFFINNFTKKKNSMIFVLLLSLIGLIMLMISPPYIITGTLLTMTYNGTLVVSTTSTWVTTPFGYNWMWALSFVTTLILSVYNWTIEEEGDDITST